MELPAHGGGAAALAPHWCHQPLLGEQQMPGHHQRGRCFGKLGDGHCIRLLCFLNPYHQGPQGGLGEEGMEMPKPWN